MTTPATLKGATLGRSRRLLTALATAGAIAGAMILAAPSAYALSENQIKEDCARQGGKYSTYTALNGNRVSQCCVPDRFKAGGWYCEYYVNGSFDGGQSWTAAPPPGDTGSAPPPPPEAVSPGDNGPVSANPPGGNPPASTPPPTFIP